MPCTRSLAWFSMNLFLLGAATSSSQVITGTILGVVRDGSGAVLAGATVTLSSPALPTGPSTIVTREDGQYRFLNLSPGAYRLEVALPGFSHYVEEGLRVVVGGTVERKVTLHLAGVSESVTVSGRSSIVDTRKAGLSTNFDNDLIDKTPVRRVSLFDLTKSAPGMSESGEFSRQVSAFGSNTDENLYLVDGTDFTSPISGSISSDPDPDIVEEIEIVSLGTSAEYGNMTGAVFNVVTRQGTNAFRFDASYFGMFDGLTAKPTLLDCDCPLGETGFVLDHYRDLTAHAGGPIVKNEAWFFGGFQYFRGAISQPGVDSRFPQALEAERVFYKLTWQVSDDIKLMHSMNDDFWRFPGGVSPSRPDFGSTLRTSGRNPAFTFYDLTHVLSGNTFYDARVSGFRSPGDDYEPNGNFGQPARLELSAGVWSGSFPFSGRLQQSRLAIHGKLSHYASDFLAADHDFKFGVQFVKGSHEGHFGYPNDVIYYDLAGLPYAAKIRERYDYGGQFENLGAFAEDSLSVSDRLALQLGLRYDRIEAISPDIPRLGPDLNEIGEVQGLGALYIWNNVAPRLGFNLVLDAQGNTVLRGSWGRYFRGAQTSELSSNHPGFTPIIEAYFDSDTNEYAIVSVTDPIADVRIDPRTRAPRTDQLSIGLDRELGTDLAVAATYIRKTGSLFPGWEVSNAAYGTDTRTLANGQILEVFPILTDPSERIFSVTSREDFFSDYDGILLTFRKRWSRGWQALASYSLSEAMGLLSSNWSGPGGSQSGRVTFFTSQAGRDPNDFTNATGNLRNDRTHMFRVQAAAELSKIGMLFGVNYHYVTGKPYAAQARVLLPQGRQVVYIEPLGTRRLASSGILDLRVSKIFRFGEGGRLEILGDILNLTNDQAPQNILTTQFDSPNFERPTLWTTPRRLMIGVKLVF